MTMKQWKQRHCDVMVEIQVQEEEVKQSYVSEVDSMQQYSYL